MPDNPMAEQLVDAVLSDFPDHQPGTRPVHTIGIGVQGYFEASEVARNYTIAAHFQGQRVPVTVRFSNGTGSPVEHDGWSDVRGMATRFHLGDDAATDLIAMTLAEFFAPSVDAFLQFSRAARPARQQRESPWLKILDMLCLKQPLPDPMPGQMASGAAGMLAFANQHRFAQMAVFQAGSIGAPVSYVRAAYHAVHTFILTGPDHVRRPVRFSWEPIAGVRTTDPTAPPVDCYLHQELKDRLQRQPATFRLVMSIGEIGDAYADPTRQWPGKRCRVFMGTLTLTTMPSDQEKFCEKISFNPCRLTKGIDISDDPILQARRDAYEVSRLRRGGQSCPFAAG
jgi:catalase